MTTHQRDHEENGLDEVENEVIFLRNQLRVAAAEKEKAVAFAKKEALTTFTVWLLKTHGLLIDEELLHTLGGP